MTIQTGTRLDGFNSPVDDNGLPWILHQDYSAEPITLLLPIAVDYNGNPLKITDNVRLYQKKIFFPTPFTTLPEVTVALNFIDATPSNTSSANNIRVSAFVRPNSVAPNSLTTTYFTLVFATWSKSRAYGLGVSWIAVGN